MSRIPAGRRPRFASAAAGFLLFLLFVPAAGRAGAGPGLRELIDRMAVAFAGRGTVGGRFVQEVDLRLMGETRRYGGRVWYRHPDRLRLEYDEPAGQLLVCDGTAFWMLLTDQGRPQVFRTPVAGEIGGFLSHRSLEILSQRYDSRLDGVEEVDGAACQRVVFEVAPDDLTARFRDLVLWVDVRDLYTRRLSYEDAAGNRVTYSFEGWHPVDDAPASLFTFSPPPGADRFDESLRPILPGTGD